LAAAIYAGEEAPIEPGMDPLEGRWLISEGREVKDEGYYFDASVSGACGNAHFRGYPQRKVNFDPERLPGSKAAPWGVFGYKFDPNGVLTLSRAEGPDIRCFLKFKSEQTVSIGNEAPHPRPFVCVFYDPERRHAFKMFRMGEEIGALAIAGESLKGETIFVPFMDVLTGSWVMLPGRPTGSGQLEFRLDAAAAPGAMRLTVRADNSAELKAGEAAARFRLRQFDPSHWAIVSPLDAPCATGTIALEKAAGLVVGPNILITRWRLGARTMTAVLQAEGSRGAPDVLPALRFEGAESFNIETLRATSPTSPVPGQPATRPK
jgi:hypothetical protein